MAEEGLDPKMPTGDHTLDDCQEAFGLYRIREAYSILACDSF